MSFNTWQQWMCGTASEIEIVDQGCGDRLLAGVMGSKPTGGMVGLHWRHGWFALGAWLVCIAFNLNKCIISQLYCCQKYYKVQWVHLWKVICSLIYLLTQYIKPQRADVFSTKWIHRIVLIEYHYFPFPFPVPCITLISSLPVILRLLSQGN